MNQIHSQPSVIVGLRYDDFSSVSSIELERQFLALCAQYDAPCTFGVVPNYHLPSAKPTENMGTLNHEKKELLRQGIAQGIVEVALHGFNHQSIGGKTKSEFHGLSLEAQNKLIAQGKSILEGAVGPIQTFIPPWNSYDQNTLSALKANGFKVLSAASNGLPDKDDQLILIPATCLIEDLKMAVEKALQLSKLYPLCRPMVVGYFHPYDFIENNPQRGRFTLGDFEKILRWLRTHPEVDIQAIHKMGYQTKFGSKEYVTFSFLARLLPSSLEKFLRPIFWAYPYPSIRVPVLKWLWSFGMPKH